MPPLLGVVIDLFGRSVRFSGIVGEIASRSKNLNFFQNEIMKYTVSNGMQY